MKPQTVYIGFGGCQVAVHSPAREVIAGVARDFQAMLAPPSSREVGRLEVQWQNGRYQLTGNREATGGDGSLAESLRGLKYEVALHLIHARPDLLWLHAGAAACEGRAVLIAGRGGRGKSTLVTSLCARGWRYLADDIVPLDITSGQVLPFPQTPAVREDPGQEMPVEQVPELPKAEVELDPVTICREPLPVGAVVFPAYSRRTRTEFVPVPPASAALELLQNCLNFPDHGEAAVRYLSELVPRLPTFRLSFRSGSHAAGWITRTYRGWMAQSAGNDGR